MNELMELLNLPDAYLSGPALLCGLAGLGLVAGVLSGLFGVGGAFLITPLLAAMFGIPYPYAIGSGLCYAIGVGATGFARHHRLKNVEIKSMVILGLGGVIGAVLGAMLNEFLQARLGKHHYDLTMDALFICMLTLSGWLVFRGKGVDKRGLSVLQRVPLPPYVDLPDANLVHVSLIGMFASGLSIGVLKGLMGIGGGVMFMPLLILMVGLTPHQAVGTSLGVVLFSSISGTIKYGLAGTCSLGIALVLLVGSTVGVQIGAWWCQKIRGIRLRRYFAILVFTVAIVIAFKFARGLLAS